MAAYLARRRSPTTGLRGSPLRSQKYIAFFKINQHYPFKPCIHAALQSRACVSMPNFMPFGSSPSPYWHVVPCYILLPLIHADFGSRSFSLALVLRVCGPAAVGLCGSGSCCPRPSYRRWTMCPSISSYADYSAFFYPCRSMARPFFNRYAICAVFFLVVLCAVAVFF